MSGLNILIEGEHNVIEFGRGVTVNASKYQPTVINALGGCRIQIGAGALFSNNIEVHSTDYHGIYDNTGKRINPDEDIVIGNNVWIGLGCKILKGAAIQAGSVVGAGSLVTRKFNEENVILAGNPARIIKHNIIWDNVRADTYQDLDSLKSK